MGLSLFVVVSCSLFQCLEFIIFSQALQISNTRDLPVTVLSLQNNAVYSCLVAGYGLVSPIFSSSCGSWSQV